jgi:hypothetical protein
MALYIGSEPRENRPEGKHLVIGRYGGGNGSVPTFKVLKMRLGQSGARSGNPAGFRDDVIGRACGRSIA